MSEPTDLDELLAREDGERALAARREMRMRALWVEAEAAIRTDPQYAIDIAEEAHRAIAFELGREARSERSRHASQRAVASRAARKAAASGI